MLDRTASKLTAHGRECARESCIAQGRSYHLHISDSLRRNLSVQYYESGHMMYLNQPDAEKLRHDIVEFIQGT